MNGSNVNNSISHPPHPRRAVPANLPPGAFFFFKGAVKWFTYAIFTTSLYLSSIALHASDDDLFQKIAELRLKSNAHGRFVNDLLVNEPKFHPLEAPVQTSIENDPIDNKPEPAPSLPDFGRIALSSGKTGPINGPKKYPSRLCGTFEAYNSS